MMLREMIAGLERIYADSIGSEFMHIQDPRVREWIRKRLETRPHKHSTPRAVQVALLRALLEAESFEIFLHTRFVGQKRFSLQGSETLMVALETILHKCPEGGVEEICMGMAHRGRLNVLANFLRKSLKVIFTEFSENYIPDLVAGDGDVKYHLGYQAVRRLASGAEIEIRLSSNPSHLEAVDPVVEGKARARQRIRGDTEHRKRVLPLLVHGDAAFIAQGIVAETLNLSQLHGYSTGGSIHIVVNNQIGFTTLPKDARSSSDATDVAKMIEAPIFHVNGDDPLAVKFVSDLAFDFRQQFGRDADRHVLLSSVRPQRRRRTVVYPARSLREDRETPISNATLQTRVARSGHTQRRRRRLLGNRVCFAAGDDERRSRRHRKTKS